MTAQARHKYVQMAGSKGNTQKYDDFVQSVTKSNYAIMYH